MNIKTITFDADKYQLVPKEPDHKMLAKMRATHWTLRGCQLCSEDYFDIHTAMLASAPQPPELSPWLPIDDFLKKPVFFCPCFVFHKGEVKEGYIHKFIIKDIETPRFYPNKFSNNCFLTESISHVYPITQPQAPEVE